MNNSEVLERRHSVDPDVERQSSQTTFFGSLGVEQAENCSVTVGRTVRELVVHHLRTSQEPLFYDSLHTSRFVVPRLSKRSSLNPSLLDLLADAPHAIVCRLLSLDQMITLDRDHPAIDHGSVADMSRFMATYRPALPPQVVIAPDNGQVILEWQMEGSILDIRFLSGGMVKWFGLDRRARVGKRSSSDTINLYALGVVLERWLSV